MTIGKVHIGNQILKKIKQRGIPKAELARRMHCHFTGLYRLLKKDSINTNTLIKFCIVLEYNFFVDYAGDERLKNIKEQDNILYKTKEQSQKAKQEVEKLLLENNRLKDQIIKLQTELLKLKK